MRTGFGRSGFGARLFGRPLSALRAIAANWEQRDGDHFTLAYARSLGNRLPLLYLVVVFDLVLVAYRFREIAPLWLIALGPIALGSIALWRAFYWRPLAVERRPLPVLRRDLAVMSWTGAAVAFLFALWSMSLYVYGDWLAQSFVHYICAVTLFSAILSLGHSPITALRIAIATTIPTSGQLLFSRHPNAVLVVLVQIVVTTLLLLITNGHHRSFVRLELSRQQLARREREAARLAQENLLHATVDPLTGALNRRAILDRLEKDIVLGQDGAPRAWLALIDLDGFKHVNDTYGHAAGDAVLQAVATRLAGLERVRCFGRLGGDEFAAVLDPALDHAAVFAIGSALSDLLRAPVQHGSAVLRLSGSIGIHRMEGRSVSDCLERADAALYKAKELSDGAVVVFSPEDETELQNRAAITRQFNDSDLADRLKLVYQPVFDAEGCGVIGFEAFVRWSPDGERWLAPGQFIPLAEATGRTGELTRMVMVRALRECPAWEHGRWLSINLTPRDVMRSGTADALARLVEEHGAPPHAIILEVTERALMDDPRRAKAQLLAFRERGFRIALDDFGAGWSSLSQVHSLPLDMIKIDQALSRALTSDPGARSLVGTIVSLAWQLGIDCTIEGIEDEAQATTARALGIRLMQGYHLARPQDARDALALITDTVVSLRA